MARHNSTPSCSIFFPRKCSKWVSFSSAGVLLVTPKRVHQSTRKWGWHYYTGKSESHSVMSDSLQPHRLEPATLLCPWNSPGQNIGVGRQFPFLGDLPNPGLLHCKRILCCLSQGSPRILKWVAHPFFSGSSQPRNRTGVSCIAGGFFTSWATREWVILN